MTKVYYPTDNYVQGLVSARFYDSFILFHSLVHIKVLDNSANLSYSKTCYIRQIGGAAMPLLKSYENEAAFERLYHQYVNLMLYTTYQILQNSEDAENAVQTVFLRIATHFSSVEKISVPKRQNIS